MQSRRRCAEVIRAGLSAGVILMVFGTFDDLPAAERTGYRTRAQCDGLPRISVTTPAGVCVGLVATGLNFPRGILPLDTGELLVVTMGGWEPNHGAVWKLTRGTAAYERQQLVGKLDRPHGIALGPDGRVYVGVVGGVVRFDPRELVPSAKYVIGGTSGVPGLPDDGRHPLVNLAFDAAGDLYLGVGSYSDNCEARAGTSPDANGSCAEAEGTNPRGSVRLYRFKWPDGAVVASEIFATGLRNSMALAVHPATGRLWQGENSRDAIHRHIPSLKDDEDLPHDELNRIVAGGNYGWPYCYDDGLPSPEFPNAQCAVFQKPVMLLPAHAAPLGMAFYASGLLPIEYHNSVLIAFHGYRKHGHRVVAIAVDAEGNPAGGLRDLVWGWEASAGRPKGAPVDLRVGSDGAIYVTEDRNGTVLRIGRTKN